jgi:hypothetical protein
MDPTNLLGREPVRTHLLPAAFLRLPHSQCAVLVRAMRAPSAAKEQLLKVGLQEFGIQGIVAVKNLPTGSLPFGTVIALG